VDELGSAVGDELQFNYSQIGAFQSQITSQQRSLHSIAQQRKTFEQDATAYIPWLEKSLEQDKEDINFCVELEAKLASFAKVRQHIRDARDGRITEERRKQEAEERARQLQKEKDEQEKFRQAALAKETESKPGMVWNPVAREYQNINTDETWRDH
jgi:hypothetical protein